MIPKKSLIFVLSVFLAIPIWAVPELVGTVASSKSTSARGSDLTTGMTLFSGDTISVAQGGDARISLAGGSQLRLAQSSVLRFAHAGKTHQLELIKGQVNFRSMPQSLAEGILGDATFRPASDSSASVGVISFLTATTVAFFAQQGDWLILTAHDGKSTPVREGTAMEARLAHADELSASDLPAGYHQRPPRAAVGGGALLVILIGLLLIGGVLLAAFLLGSNESGLNCQQQINAVSPITPCSQ